MRVRVPGGTRSSQRRGADGGGGRHDPHTAVPAVVGPAAGPVSDDTAGAATSRPEDRDLHAAPSAGDLDPRGVDRDPGRARPPRLRSTVDLLWAPEPSDPVVSDADVSAEVGRRTGALLAATARAGVAETSAVLLVLVLYAVLPGRPPLDATAYALLLSLTILATAAMAVAIQRARTGSRSATVVSLLWVGFDTTAICAAIAETGGSRSDLYLLLLVVAVFQAGATYPRHLRLAFNGAAVAGYLATLAVLGWHVGTATVVFRVGMLAALAWGTDMLSENIVAELRQHVRLRLDSQRRARLWRRVAALGGTLTALDEEAIWDWVIDAIAELGYAAASVCVFEEDRRTYTVARAVGLPQAFTGTRQQLTVGMAGIVLETDRTTVADYATFDRAVGTVRSTGMRTTVGVPIRVHGTMAAVLVAGTTIVRRPGDEELAALELVAANAGHGLAAARAVTGERRDAESVRTILASAPDAMLVYDDRGIVHQANRQAARLFGYRIDELVGADVTELGTGDGPAGEPAAARGGTGTDPGSAAGGAHHRRPWGQPPPDGLVAIAAGAVRGVRKDGSSFPAEIVLAPVDDPANRLVAATIRDVSERLALESRLAHHATHDDLTGLPNRTLFLEHLDLALGDARGHDTAGHDTAGFGAEVAAAAAGTAAGTGPHDPGSPHGPRGPHAPGAAATSTVAVFFLDIDHFKYVNDSRGHDVGDQLVTDVGRRLEIASGGGLVARFGGDEFAVLRSDVADSHDALARAWRLLGAFDRPFLLDGVECHLSASVGVAFGTRSDRALDVIRRADAAMYHAKQRGRARVELFDEVLTARAAWRFDIATALHDAVDNGELRLVYQPVVSLGDGSIVGVEALLRWQRPSGPVSPATFVPVAEDSGLIVPIGRWVLQQACRQAAAWHRQGIDPGRLRISVNVSSRQLDHDRLIGDVAGALGDTGIPPTSLVLEITESAFIDDLPAAARRIEALRQLGVHIAIDDFGTGFSSLSSLSLLPVDTVKVDKTFIDGLGTRYDTIIRAVVDVAETFGLRVVAEGVERVDQAERLAALGCRYAQGFLYARPLEPEDAGAALQRGVLLPGTV